MITIPFPEHRGYVSGIVTFMQNLQAYLDAQRYPYTETFRASDTIFFPVKYNLRQLAIIKKAGGKVIQRLDGIYYPQKHDKQYEALNHETKKIYQQYADFVVFQSEHSKDQCFAMFGKKPSTTCKTIYNGVDKTIFFSDSTVAWPSHNKVKFITTGGFRNVDMIEPLVQALDELASTLSFELTIVGPVQNNLLKPFFRRSYIKHLAYRNSEEIAALLRQHHIFLYAHLNPPCPNSVIEAISCGVPVVGFDSGAMRELCFFSPELLAYVSDDVFQQYKDFQPSRLKEKIQLAISSYPYFREQALQHSHLYAFEDTGAAYIRVFDQMRQQAAQTFDAPHYKQLERTHRRKSQVRHWYILAKSKLYGLAKRIVAGKI